MARVEDLVLLYFSGMLGHRPRCAVALEAMVQDYFQVPGRIDQFQGQWLQLEPLEPDEPRRRCRGTTSSASRRWPGDRVWDRKSKFRVRLGPMSYAQFVEFLPDRAPIPERKTFFLLVAPGPPLRRARRLDFDVQLVLKAEDVPECQLTGDGTFGARLGWNTWLLTRPASTDAEDVVIDGAKAF